MSLSDPQRIALNVLAHEGPLSRLLWREAVASRRHGALLTNATIRALHTRGYVDIVDLGGRHHYQVSQVGAVHLIKTKHKNSEEDNG